MTARTKLGLQHVATSGGIDYRLAREATLAAFRDGDLSREQLCDAQRELVRNAEFCGTPPAETVRCASSRPSSRSPTVFGLGCPSTDAVSRRTVRWIGLQAASPSARAMWLRSARPVGGITSPRAAPSGALSRAPDPCVRGLRGRYREGVAGSRRALDESKESVMGLSAPAIAAQGA